MFGAAGESTTSLPTTPRAFPTPSGFSNSTPMRAKPTTSTMSKSRLRFRAQNFVKRNHIKHFTAQNPQMSVEPLGESNFAQTMRFMDAEDEKKLLFAEEVAIGAAFANFDELGLYGTVLYSAPDKIAAAAIIGKITDEVHSVHFEKSDKLVEGASQMIVKCEAEAIASRGGKFMNREQDLGDPNLRRAKQSLDPTFMYARLGATRL